MTFSITFSGQSFGPVMQSFENMSVGGLLG
ncbi:hypothetical protein LF1_21620 [Rubripirellula obstinata]|uniref:Uncharacterized protein n=1 Tax=Rubripirellula obstinata TaxID=406547 RepID=A0A5B1CEQ4_9BACT|nr:hypothetical protein LF1_21620 [Rubripirellula obstinata]